MSSDWFLTGNEAEERITEESKKQQGRGKFVRRYWLPVGVENSITFVDGPSHPAGYKLPFVCLEHQLYLSGHWRNWLTCLSRMTDEQGNKVICPICESGAAPYLAGAYTVIDHNEWTDKQGVNHKDELRLFIVKGKVLKILKRAAAKRNGLRGWKVDVSRADNFSPSTGDTFDFTERVELPKDIQPFDYREVLKPKSESELRRIVGVVYEEDEDTMRY